MSRGFAITEVIVALFVLTLGAGAAFALAAQTRSSTSLVKSQLVASYLAQEGVEIVRNIRDTNFLKVRTSGGTWDEGLTGCADGCGADYDDTQLSPSLASEYLVYDATEGFYTYPDPPASSGFQRVITITEDPQTEALQVFVVVSWEDRGEDYQVEAHTELFNWIEP